MQTLSQTAALAASRVPSGVQRLGKRRMLLLAVAPALAWAPALQALPRAPLLRLQPPVHVTMSVLSDDPWATYAVLTAAGAAGLRLGTTTAIGRVLSGPILTMLLTFSAASTGLLPPAAAAVQEAQALSVRLATPVLLFGADLRAVARRAGRLLPAFLLGTLGTFLGALIAIGLLRAPLASSLGADGLKVAMALAAKNVGGGINFVAVAGALGLAPLPMAAGLAADNLMALIYFPLCAFLGRSDADPYGGGAEDSAAPATAAGSQSAASQSAESQSAEAAEPQPVGASELSAALAVGVAAIAIARWRSPAGYDLPLASFLAVAAATALPQYVKPLAQAGERLGTVCLYIFFATAGWTGGALGAFLSGGLVLLGFLAILYSVHLGIMRAAWSAGLFPRPVMLTASNANIGGPATACALAVAKGWEGLVTPALLVGNLGYALATPIALLLYRCLSLR